MTLRGLGCCHDLELGVGDTSSMTSITFRKAYLLSNLAAALAAVALFTTGVLG